MAVRGVAVALAEDVETRHEDRGSDARARALARFGGHAFCVVPPGVPVPGERLGDTPVDLAIRRAEEWYGGAGDREVVQELGTT